ncbi:MAG: DUF1638 domain-containing protein [Methanotrichaceae archaeon]
MYAIVACGIFEDEIEKIAEDLDFPFEAHYLEPGLHVDFDELAATLKAKLEECKDYDGIIIAYGDCHPKMAEILSPYKAELLKCQNCIDAFITRKKVETIAKQGLYFYLSPGWVKSWRNMFDKMNWDRDETRFQLAPFKGTIFIDTLKNAEDYEQGLIEFLDYTLLVYEIMPTDLDHFRSLIVEAKERLEE